MKNLSVQQNQKLAFYILMAFFFTFTSCGSDDDITPDPNPTPTATCIDGIQNGNETGVDCGGDCDECVSIIGVWSVLTLSINGSDALAGFGVADAFQEYGSNAAFSSFSINTEGDATISSGSYAIDNNSVTLTTSNSTTTFNYTLTTNLLSFNGTDSQGNLIESSYERVITNLCASINCGNGDCFYGYCVCDEGWIGSNCQSELGPSGGIVIYDAGDNSAGWRYIEVSRTIFPAASNGCQAIWDNFTSTAVGFGLDNTIFASNNCFEPTMPINVAGLYTQAGFDNWHLPSKDEVQLVIPHLNSLENFSWDENYSFHTSTFMVDGFSYHLNLWVEDQSQWLTDFAGIEREFVVVRYY